MSSSNRHWPSMFKSKPSTNNPFHHDLNFPNSRNPYSQDEERTPEPKPRWNPRPEQIRILEAIFNSGTVNPPREEIRRIRAQLQEFGQVGDANVFYWFQNRKSRSKHKQQRHLGSSKRRAPPVYPAAGLAQASPSSSSEKSSSNENKPLSLGPTAAASSQPFLQGFMAAAAEPLLFSPPSHGICFPVDLSQSVEDCSGDLLGDVMAINRGRSIKDDEKLQPQISYAAPDLTTVLPSSPAPHRVSQVEPAPPKSTVFINDVCFEISAGLPFNVREAFGNDTVLVESSGQAVPTDEWGVTQQPLQHGGFYYLLRSFAPSPQDKTIDLI